MAKVKFCSYISFLIIYIFLNLHLITPVQAIEIIRDTELENFTDEIITKLLGFNKLESADLKIYFINSNEINAFVTGGKNIFINTELIIEADDYREYAAVLAHELAHIIGGHIFKTSIEVSNLSDKALPIYLLGILGAMTGSADVGLAGIMVGQASVSDGFTYYSRTQEASADQAAVRILCDNGIDASYLINFLKKLEKKEISNQGDTKNYKSTHPLVKDRIEWINLSLQNNKNCKHSINPKLEKQFQLLKAKIHGFTHSHKETLAIYNSKNKAEDLYAAAVSKYFKGDHNSSIKNLKVLVEKYPNNPYYKELLGEIYYANNDYEKAFLYQKEAINEIGEINDLYFMILGNYLLAFNDNDKKKESIRYLKKSIQLNSNNAYSWYLLARAYAETGNIALANYATAERYFLVGERSLSFNFAVKAYKNIEKNTPEWYRSYDLIEILEKEVSTNR